MNNSNTSDTIKLDSLTIGYKTRDGIRTVAKDINASIISGKLTCLIGTNGIGKSTLLRTLSGFQPRLGGSIVINGSELSGYKPRDLSRVVSVVLTSRPSSVNFTVEEIVALGRTPYTGFWGTLSDKDKAIVDESMKLAGIYHLAKRNAMSLSDGERQKMMIAKALAQQTPVIMLDEPTAFLDYPSKVETMLLLAHLCRDEGKTIFMSSHDLELVIQLADILWVMEQDGTLSVGTPDALADDGTLSRFIERTGIKFDKEAMKITVCKNWTKRHCKHIKHCMHTHMPASERFT